MLNSGDTAWMIVSSALVLQKTPGPAALLGVGGAAGLWLWRAPGNGVQVLAAAGALALAAVAGMVWLTRARAARRWKAALDAYAAQEIVRASRRQRGARGQGGLEVPVVPPGRLHIPAISSEWVRE
jgi:hypothetical protein